MRNWILIFFIILAGCSTGESRLLEALSANGDPDDGMTEIVCVRGSVSGTFTNVNAQYLKKVYPEGEPAPDC